MFQLAFAISCPYSMQFQEEPCSVFADSRSPPYPLPVWLNMPSSSPPRPCNPASWAPSARLTPDCRCFSCSAEAKSGYNTSACGLTIAEEREIIMSSFLLMQPGMQLSFLAAKMHCWFMFNLMFNLMFTRTSRSYLQNCFPVRAQTVLYVGLFLTRAGLGASLD